jgi:hypothetical protein
MFRLWIERRFSRPVTAAGFFWCWLGPWPCRHWRWGSISMIIATPIEAPDQSESRFFSHYDPKTVEWFMLSGSCRSFDESLCMTASCKE